MISPNEYVRADSRNLPEINMAIIMEYFHSSDKHNIAEIRGLKTLMASRNTYTENAVGYVELKRTGSQCIVRAKVVPEHKVTKKYYCVTIELNERDSTIAETTCDGCPASEGGCKHTLVVLFWLEKRTMEPSSTSVHCYWKKPRLASEATQPVDSKTVSNSKKTIRLDAKDPTKLEEFYRECKKQNIGDSLLTSFAPGYDKGLLKYCMFDLILEFVTSNDDSHEYDLFISCMSEYLNKDITEKIEKKTIQQSDSRLWHSMRQGRITGSKIYDICHCRTPDGSLVEQILGGYKVYETEAMRRGKTLEKHVLKEVELQLKTSIQACGFTLINLISGASPDGKTEDYLIEIKCPTTKKTAKNYVHNNIIKEKYLAQCQIQMLATGHKQSAFCVADPDFTNNKKVEIFWVQYNAEYANKLLQQAETFWKNNIYPKILQSVKS